ncbi:protein angel homolog 2 [Anopheles bellator]|uniref:protein angel homolog 2 n=1 Tax=Anopheles bellator TaxID=139047 RepID=UPI002648C728|nr:protein angel homolog 2 [Anopheles bellator]
MSQRLQSVLAISTRHVQNYGRRRNLWCFLCNNVDSGGTAARHVMDPPTATFQPPVRLMHQGAYFDTRRRWQLANSTEKSSPTKRNAAKGKPTPTETAGSRFEFTLMSYNILAQDLLEDHAALYRRNDSRALPWKHRLDRLLAEIRYIRPEVLCVQELQENHLNQFCDGLADFRYQMLYKKRTGGDKTDGCAVFFRSDLFELIAHHEVEYFQPNVNRLNRENVAIIAKLAVKQNPQTKLVVSTTHLLYNPRRQDVRLAQIQVLLAELDRFAYSGRMPNGVPQYDPVILCGDFNLQPFSAPYRLMTDGCLRYDRLTARTLEQDECAYDELAGKTFLPQWLGITDQCQHDTLHDRDVTHPNVVPPQHRTRLHHSEVVALETEAPKVHQKDSKHSSFASGSLKHRFVFSSAYDHGSQDPSGDDAMREATTYQDRWITVDYLFYTPYRSVAECCPSLPNWNLELLGTYALPTVQQCRGEPLHIPNMFYGSDHFSLAGRFLLSTPGLGSRRRK